jgi:hypothetical protein
LSEWRKMWVCESMRPGRTNLSRRSMWLSGKGEGMSEELRAWKLLMAPLLVLTSMEMFSRNSLLTGSYTTEVWMVVV